MKDQIIHLDATDTLDSARDRLQWLRAEHVLLVFPDDPRNPILQRPLDLTVLQRAVEQRDARLTLVTRDSIIQQNAKHLSLTVFPSLEAYQKRYLRRQLPRQMAVEQPPSPETSHPPEGQPVAVEPLTSVSEVPLQEIDNASSVTVEKKVSAIEKRSRGLLGLVASSVIITVVVFVIVLPSAQVVIQGESQRVSLQVDSVSSLTENSLRVKDDDVAVPSRQIFVALQGSQVKDVQAAPFVVTEAVMTDLMDALVEKLLQDFEADLADPLVTPLLETEFPLPETIEILGILKRMYSAERNERVERLSLELTVQAAVTVIDERPAREEAYRRLISEVRDGQRLDVDSVIFQRRNEHLDADADIVTFTVEASTLIRPEFETSTLARDIVGRQPDTAREVVQERLSLQTEPKISITPNVFPIMPLLPSRIEVIVDDG